jgi:hypothetical protein
LARPFHFRNANPAEIVAAVKSGQSPGRVCLGSEAAAGGVLQGVMLMVQGFFGKAALFKHIPVYYPDQVDVVGGAVARLVGWAASSCRWLSA